MKIAVQIKPQILYLSNKKLCN